MSLKICELEILFQDEYFVAINKISGLLVHATKIDSKEKQFALQILRDQIGKRVYPVHRLDKATSGVLLFAKSPVAARAMTDLFTRGQIEKKYLAVVRGFMSERVELEYPLKEIQDRKTDFKANKTKKAQNAKTNFRLLSQCELDFSSGVHPTSRYSLIEATPQTGRKHQIRRHLKHLSHPIVGDVNYGSGIHNQIFRTKFNCHRLLLACTSLGFQHPVLDTPVRIQASLDAKFEDLLLQIGLK